MPVFDLVPVLFSFPVEREVSFLTVDGKALYPAFEKTMRKAGKRKELDLLAARFESLALGESLPPNAIKPIKGRPAGDDWEEFELRNKSLRVYLFVKPPNGNIIVMGEYKKGAKDQRKTIAEFQELKQAFKAQYLKLKNEEE
jgi:hypothetical protein